MRLYNALSFEHERRTQQALKSSRQAIWWGVFFSGSIAAVLYFTTRPMYALPLTPTDKAINGLLVFMPFVVSIINNWINQRRLRKGLFGPVFYLVFGHIEAMVPTGEFVLGAKGGGNSRALFNYMLSQAMPATLGPGGVLHGKPVLAHHSVAARHAHFYTHESLFPKIHSDVIFLCDKTWRFGSPFKFDMLENAVLAQKQHRAKRGMPKPTSG